ncbi:N-acetyllactosaminide 3-alpha-galactosyltransferase [Oesophagostomum dentatum]|uniref:Hexosyltransferase n=1 Tax=Oesophagostomum dentatum TaxID=61180 RepID=A0A0B1TCT6_OESDE|nr:N-acetyllactosaminide 3-alpha-galactosyltransferase [Oesophagostomum dentatum]
MLAAYRWIHENHPRKFVLKMDSDIVAFLDKIEPVLGNPSDKTVQCHPYTGSIPDRNSSSPWYVPESVYREYYLPDYCSGPLYLMSPAALAAILQVAPEEKVFEVEDAFFTGVLAAKAGVVMEKIRGIWVKKKESQPCVNNKGTVISYPVHSDDPTRLTEAWKHLKQIRCRYPVEHFILTFLYND